MRWLLLKDLRILKRSPLLVSLLVIYPVVIAVLIGLALSRGPNKPRVAVLDQVPASRSTFSIDGQTIDIEKYAQRLYSSIDPVFVHSRAQAVAEVRSGGALAALIIPPDLTDRLRTGLEQAQVEVIYNAADPVKARFVQHTIASQLASANAALSARFTALAANDIRLLLTGGSFDLLGRQIQLLGLRNSERILNGVLGVLPAGSAERAALQQVVHFAGVAIDNLDLSNKVLHTVSAPIEVKQTSLSGSATALDDYGIAIAVTVSLMFVTVLLAAGMLALEREEHAFSRLVRGLVSRSGLIAEKAALAAVCAFAVTVAMLAALSAFVPVHWERAGLWLPALAVGALAFGALGLAIGALAREVRAASLLAFLLSLPIAFLALVPSGTVGGGLYEAISVVSAIFPFKPALEAANAGLNAGGAGIGVPLAHLAGLAVGFGILARLALRRFA